MIEGLPEEGIGVGQGVGVGVGNGEGVPPGVRFAYIDQCVWPLDAPDNGYGFATLVELTA